jgi:hypothetical protein
LFDSTMTEWPSEPIEMMNMIYFFGLNGGQICR